MFRGILLAAACIAASTPAVVAARTVVLYPESITADSVTLQGSDGNPVRLLSFEVTSTQAGTIQLPYFDAPTLSVVAGRAYTFMPNALVPSNQYGQYYSILRVLNSGNVEAVATWSNITLELGDQFRPVPEPATWAMMIIGFGLAGAVARRERKHATA
jgi:hypothetical protein